MATEVRNVNGDALYDAFDDEILIADNNRLNMNLTNGWELAENGQIILIGTEGTLAVIEGGDLDYQGTLILQRRVQNVSTTDYTDIIDEIALTCDRGC